MRELCTILQRADGDDGTPLHIEFVSALGVGVDGHFGRRLADGVNHSTLEVEVAVGVETIVAGGIGADVAAGDGHSGG